MSRLFEAMQRAAAQDDLAVETTPHGPVPVEAVSGIDAFRAEAKLGEGSRTVAFREQLPDPMPQTSAPMPVASTAPISPAEVPVGNLHDAAWRGAFIEYRRLAARLIEQRTSRLNRSIVVMSAVPGEGKSLTALNLARTLAHTYGRTVLLVDADLRKPRLHTELGVPLSPGFADSIAQGAVANRLPVAIGGGLDFISAGLPNSEPSGLLSSPAVNTLLAEWSTRYEWIVFDTPPAVLMPDAALLSRVTDIALLVIHAGTTKVDDVQLAIESVGNERIAGVVLNRLPKGAAPPERYDTHYSAYAESEHS